MITFSESKESRKLNHISFINIHTNYSRSDMKSKVMNNLSYC